MTHCSYSVSFILILLILFPNTGCHDNNKNKQITNIESVTPVESNLTSQWPRTIETLRGKITLYTKPQRIVSTSVTLTGTLLAINAPLVGSGATAPNTPVSDDQGFFIQWATIAKQRQIKPLYIGEPNAELIAAVLPDLILVSTTGGDSALKIYDQLASIAPTILIDYSDKSWQQLTQQLGYIIGHEEDANKIINTFEQRIHTLRETLHLPTNPISAFVYYEDGRGVNLWTTHSAQGNLLNSLGFTLANLPNNLKTITSMGIRHDIIQLSGEQVADGLTGQSFLLFATSRNTIADITHNPFFQHLPAIRNNQLYDMGADTFRLDYYSATNMLDRIENYFSVVRHRKNN